MARPNNRAALFARYSSRLQNALSLEAQVTEIEKFCEKENLVITHRYLLPEQRSATIEKSPKFQQMLEAAGQREFDVLVVHKIDRFSRDRVTNAVQKEFLRRKGVRIVSVSENIGMSDAQAHTDRLMEGFLELFAEQYSRNLGVETRKGQKQTVRSGRHKGGKPLYGYTLRKTEEGTYLEPHPEQAAIVLEVFRRYVAGDVREKIMDWVEEQTGQRWEYTVFQNRIRNPTYKGLLVYGKTHLSSKGQRSAANPDELTYGECKAIVPTELWDQAQAQMDRAPLRNRRARYKYILSEGLAVCASCGRGLVGAQQGGRGTYPYYLCPGWRSQACERQKAVRAEDLEAAVISRIAEARTELETRDWGAVGHGVLAKRRQLFDARLAAMAESLADLENKKNQLVEFIMTAGAKAPVALVDKINELEAEAVAVAARMKLAQEEEESKEMILTAQARTLYYTSLDDMKEDPGSPRWKRGCRALLTLVWDFQSGTGALHLLPDQFLDQADLKPERLPITGRTSKIGSGDEISPASSDRTPETNVSECPDSNWGPLAP